MITTIIITHELLSINVINHCSLDCIICPLQLKEIFEDSPLYQSIIPCLKTHGQLIYTDVLIHLPPKEYTVVDEDGDRLLWVNGLRSKEGLPPYKDREEMFRAAIKYK